MHSLEIEKALAANNATAAGTAKRTAKPSDDEGARSPERAFSYAADRR